MHKNIKAIRNIIYIKYQLHICKITSYTGK